MTSIDNQKLTKARENAREVSLAPLNWTGKSIRVHFSFLMDGEFRFCFAVLSRQQEFGKSQAITAQANSSRKQHTRK